MSFPRRVHAVVFDMDGLLVDTEVVVFRAMQRAAGAIGGEMPFGTFQRMVGLTHASSDLILMEHFGEGFDLDAWSAAVSAHFREEMAAGIALKAGVLEILDHLDAAAMPRAIATSSSLQAVQQSLGPHSLVDRFHALITRDVQTQGKPHPEPFLKAAQAPGRRSGRLPGPGGQPQRRPRRRRGGHDDGHGARHAGPDRGDGDALRPHRPRPARGARPARRSGRLKRPPLPRRGGEGRKVTEPRA